MPNADADQSERATHSCTCCGAQARDRLYGSVGGQQTCEPCMLSRHRAAMVPDSELLDSFVESLAATLDMRERETGLHSKRVACHTLVLARRFYTDPASLQQIYCCLLYTSDAADE